MEDLDFQSTLAESVTKTLPHLAGTSKLNDLVHLLVSEGVKKERDLRHISIATLKTVLDTIDSTDLHIEWQNTFGSTLPNVPQEVPSGSNDQARSNFNQPQASMSAASQQQSVQKKARSILNTDAPTFDVNSSVMPPAVRDAILSNKRPSARDRARMVERIVEEMRDKVPNLRRDMLETVANDLVLKYPASFQDTICISAAGSDSLRFQFLTKYDNDRRPQGSSQMEREAPNSKQAYGCQLWNPSLPEDETWADQEKHMKDLQEIHKLAKKHWIFKEIKKHMDSSYCLLRRYIYGSQQESSSSRKRKRRETEEDVDGDLVNKALTIMELKERWPMLFVSKAMNHHFKTLTTVDFRRKINEFHSEKVDNLIEFLATKNEDLAKMRRVLLRAEKRGSVSAPLIGVFLMLMKQFGEDSKDMFSFVEVTTEFEELEQQAVFSKEGTPVIIVPGKSVYEAERFHLAMDFKVVATANTFPDILVLMFCSYFVFNIEYASSLICTLNFVQRVMLGINPMKGMKCKTAALNKKANEKVMKLNNKFVEYLQKLEEEEQEDM